MNKVALITGANRGIGFETARQLGKMGLTVLVSARERARGEKAIESLVNEGIDARLLVMDPTDENSVRAAVRDVEADFGWLDVLVNNAGTLIEADYASPSTVPISVFRETFEINVFALHRVTSECWHLLERSEGARLVNVSSALGSLTLHTKGLFESTKAIAYDASKAAVNMMTTHYAHQWKGTPHKANAVHPGSVKTDLNPAGQLSVEKGALTTVELATVGADGPSGGFFHLGREVPW